MGFTCPGDDGVTGKKLSRCPKWKMSESNWENTDGGGHSMEENPNSWKVYFVENPSKKSMIQDDSGVPPYGKTKETWGNILGTNYADVVPGKLKLDI
jgi:hypothetical protein